MQSEMAKRKTTIELKETGFKGLLRVYPPAFDDSRGHFYELYRESVLPMFVQTNLSESYTGVLRGLHYQLEPYSQGKLVYCLAGCIQDVVVDLRPGKTYLQHYSVLLYPDEGGLYVPPGFAHGFLATCQSTVLYHATAPYSPAHEGGLRWNDPKLGIKWEKILHPHHDGPRLSDKDRGWPLLK